MLNDGSLDGRRVFKKETVKWMTASHTKPPMKIKRGLGWDIASPYSSPRGISLRWVHRHRPIPRRHLGHPDDEPYASRWPGNVIALGARWPRLPPRRCGFFDWQRPPELTARQPFSMARRARIRPEILPKGSRIGLITNPHTIENAVRLDFLLKSDGYSSRLFLARTRAVRQAR